MEKKSNFSFENSSNVESGRNEQHDSPTPPSLFSNKDDTINASKGSMLPIDAVSKVSENQAPPHSPEKAVGVLRCGNRKGETDISHDIVNSHKVSNVDQTENNSLIVSENSPGFKENLNHSKQFEKIEASKVDNPRMSDCNSNNAEAMQTLDQHINLKQNDGDFVVDAKNDSKDSVKNDGKIIDVDLPEEDDRSERMHKNGDSQHKENGATLSNTAVEEGNEILENDSNDFYKEDLNLHAPLEKENSSSKSDDDIVSTKAAIAMAAVAVAASTNNTSPSAAAEAARALAPDLVPEAISSQDEELKTVGLLPVKTQMARKMNQPKRAIVDDDEDSCDDIRKNIHERLSLGENDTFLQHLLLLQYFRADDDLQHQVEQIPFHEDNIRDKSEPTTQSKASVAAEKVRSMLRMAEDAYGAMESLLPHLSANEKNEDSLTVSECGFSDSQIIIPDLLPPCISVTGDATHQFFRACLGEQAQKEVNASAASNLIPQKSIIETTDAIASEVPDCDLSSANTTTSVTITNEPQKSAASVLTSMFSSMTRSSRTPTSRSSATLTSVFRKRNRMSESSDIIENSNESTSENQLSQGEYSVSIDREMLGLTVENVLERTVVRTVLPGGAAKKAGAKVGSLIVKVGNVETKNLTHFETIDELRQSQRPLKLVLRQITNEALQSAREEMGRLIRGGGFGTSLPIDQNEGKETDNHNAMFRRTHHGKPSNVEAFSQVLHKRWNKSEDACVNRKYEALSHAGEKLVWILTLIVVGLEREAAKSSTCHSCERLYEGSPTRRSNAVHMAEDYSEASKCVSKVLYDFVCQKLLADATSVTDMNGLNSENGSLANALNRNRRNIAQIPGSGRMDGRARTQNTTSANTQSLLRIGDVLHRTTTFLADPASPPAALLRGEVISFLCDILDIDTEMELSEEEAGSSTTGGNVAPVNDLGSAGSLLKLVILNCLTMRSPGCNSMTNINSTSDIELEQEQLRRFGRKHTTAVDLHRFHAGNRFLAVVHRLAASRSTSARVTACSLGPVLWGHLDFPHQLQVRNLNPVFCFQLSLMSDSIFVASWRNNKSTS